jgi:hypothetical protein
MNTIVVNQPAGLGDLIFVQPILERYVSFGFKVILPIIDHYLHMVKKYLPRVGVSYVHIDSDYPFKNQFNNPNILKDGEYYYLPLAHSHRHVPNCPLMVSKYIFTQTPIVDYRECLPRIRDFSRELKLMTLMNPENSEFILTNKLFGTPPHSVEREINLESHGEKIIHIDYRDPLQSEFNPFDWIGLISAANSLHFVQTSVSLIADIYARSDTKIHLYDRVAAGKTPVFFKNIEFVQRNPAWIYHP